MSRPGRGLIFYPPMLNITAVTREYSHPRYHFFIYQLDLQITTKTNKIVQQNIQLIKTYTSAHTKNGEKDID